MDRAFLLQDDLIPQADLTLDDLVDAADYFLLDVAFLTLPRPESAAAADPPAQLLDPDVLSDLLL